MDNGSAGDSEEAQVTPHELHHGDCLEIMRGMPDNSVDAVVTDPPYGLGFLGNAWDRAVPATEYWVEALRVAKPGAHLLAFGGTRTIHRLVCAIEDAGWEVRDMIMWLYGTGLPKSTYGIGDGVGTALKPACEPITMCRKVPEGTVKANRDRHGTGALNIDACRIGSTKHIPSSASNSRSGKYGFVRAYEGPGMTTSVGRYPANVCHDGSEAVTRGFPDRRDSRYQHGGCAKFFYCSKTAPSDKDEDLFGGNPHPTIKPTPLMQWLCLLVTPPGGLVLDPFAGSGSTGKACMREGFRFVGIEQDAEYAEVARARIARAYEESALIWEG